MQFIDFLTMCEDILASLMSGVYGNGELWNVLNGTLADVALDNLELYSFFWDIPIVGGLVEDFITNVINTTLGQYSIIYLMIGAGIPAVLIFSFVKWLLKFG